MTLSAACKLSRGCLGRLIAFTALSSSAESPAIDGLLERVLLNSE
jgi:hypothetical protein